MIIMILACSCQSGQAIDVSFSAENGGEKVGVSSTYDVDADISILESNTASFGDTPSLQNSRQISGTGDANATQVCTGNAYTSRSTYDATDASTSFSSSASLLPQSLSASQIAGASGGKADSSLGITQGGATASISGGMTGGAMSASQSIWTGSAHASQGLSASGDQVRFGGTAESGDRQGYLGATTHNYQGTLDASATGDFADVMEMGELSGGYTVEGIIGGVRRSVTTVTGTWLRDMRATDADNIIDTNDRTSGLEGFNHILQTIIDETPDGGTAIFPVGALSEDVILWKNVQVIVELGGRMIANSINLVQNAELLSGSTGFFSPIVTVNEGSKINDGLQLASDSGTVTVKSGIFNDVVNQEFYSHGIQLNGEAGSVTDQIILDQYVNGKIDGLHADTVQVNQGASINDGLVLAKDSGLVSVTAGTYADNVNQGFYSRGIQLNGDDGTITSQITLDRDVNSEISGLRGSTVQVYSGASIQEGVDLATGTGTVNVDSGVADGQSVIYNKDVNLFGNGVSLNHLTLDRVAHIHSLTSGIVQIKDGAQIQDGVDLATDTGTVNVDDAVGNNQNVVYNKNVGLNANNIVLNHLTTDRDTTLISGLKSNTVQVNYGIGASINQGLDLAETDGTVNVGAGNYADIVTQGFYSKNLQLNGDSGALTNQINLDRNVNDKILGLLASYVEVGSNAKIQQALTLTEGNGIINLATGHDYAEDVDYNKGVTLNGNDAKTNKLILSTDAAGISSLLADTVDVTSAAKIQQGLYLTEAAGELNLASGHNYAEDVNYNKGVTLNGHDATTTKLTLSTDAAGIGSLLANIVDVTTAAKIQQGLYVTKEGGELNLASGNNYAEDVDYNKGVKLNGHSATANKISINRDASLISGLTASTVDVGALGTIQQGITLATTKVNLNSGTAYTQNVDYNKDITLDGNSATTSGTLTINRDASKIGEFAASTVDVGALGTIQQGITLATTKVNLNSGTAYTQNVDYNKDITLDGNSATTSGTLTINRDASKIGEFAASTVDVGALGTIQQGITLATTKVNLNSGTAYTQNVDYNKDITLDGNSATTSGTLTINRDASKIGEFAASTVDVGALGTIQQGITLATTKVNLNSGTAYTQNVDYNKDITLDGNSATTSGTLTINRDASKIGEFAASTVDVGALGTIQQGITLATTKVNLNSGTAYTQNVDYNKDITLDGNSATTSGTLTINRDASKIGEFAASTVDVGALGTIQQGITLATTKVNLNSGTAYTQNVNYNKAVTLVSRHFYNVVKYMMY